MFFYIKWNFQNLKYKNFSNIDNISYTNTENIFEKIKRNFDILEKWLIQKEIIADIMILSHCSISLLLLILKYR